MDIQDFPALQELWKLAQESPLHFGWLWLDEQTFFVATSTLKKSLPKSYIARKLAEKARSQVALDTSQPDIIFAIDELERLVDNGKYHCFGGVYVKRTDLVEKLAAVKAAITQTKKYA